MSIFSAHYRSSVPILCFVFFDILTAYAGAHLASYIRFQAWMTGLPPLVFILSLLAVLFSIFAGSYLPWRGKPFFECVANVAAIWTLSFTVLTLFMVITKTAEMHSRVWIGSWFLVVLSIAISARLLLYYLITKVRTNGYSYRKVLVITNASQLADLKASFPSGNALGYQIETIIEHTNTEEALQKVQETLTKGQTYDEFWICLPLSCSAIITPVMHAIRHTTMDIRYIPVLHDIPLINHRFSKIGNFHSLDISCTPMDSGNMVLKRMEDVLVGSAILLLITPLLMLISVTIKLSSSGPVLFIQKRHGANGQPIKIYKFRSMKAHTESAGQVTQASRNDSRITPFGAFLRRTSLDELPQFINVLQGRMSIVGPRPHALSHNEYYKDLVECYMKRHKVKPGITGLAQIRGYRGETDTLEKMQRRVESDLEYINNWSLWQDIKIITTTIFKGFIHRNAY